MHVRAATPVPTHPGPTPHRRSPTGMRPRSVLALAAALLLAVVLGPGATAASAASGLQITTPYPDVETTPGSTVKLSLTFSSSSTDSAAVAVTGLPDGWQSTLRGGGFVIHAITATSDAPATANLEITVPPDAPPGPHPFAVTASGPGGSSSLPVTIDVEEVVDAGIGLKADFPSLRGEPDTDFTYTLTIENKTPESQTFTFDPSAPQGWTVSASPTAEAKAQTVTIDAGATSDVKVTAHPPATTKEGSYDIDVVVKAPNGASGDLKLQAEVTGTPQLSLATADQRLNVKGRSGTTKRLPLIVANTGSAALSDVKLAGTAPTGWDVSFDPKQIGAIKPGETAQVTAIISPGKDAVAGDYDITIRSSAGSESSNLDLRFALQGSRALGFVAIAVIVLAVAALAGVFRRYGRR